MRMRGVQVYIFPEDIGDVGGKSTILSDELHLKLYPFVYNLTPFGCINGASATGCKI